MHPTMFCPEGSWTALAKRSDDGPFVPATRRCTTKNLGAFESGVALRFPPPSKTLGSLACGPCLTKLLRVSGPCSTVRWLTRISHSAITLA